MTIKEIARAVDNEFKRYFKNDESIKSIFVAGSMAFDDYIERADNDYDIRAVSTKVTPRQLQDFENFLIGLTQKLSTEKIGVNYSCLVGPVNHNISTSEKNFLIHAMIHEEKQLDDFLPITHKYAYAKRYRIVDGEDCIGRFRAVRYTIEDILNAHEGLNYCIDMLKRREYRYLTWTVDGETCEFTFNSDEMPEDTVYENCFYSTNKFLQNLRNYCGWNGIDMPQSQLEAAMKLLGLQFECEEVRQVMKCLINKDEEQLRKLTSNPIKLTVPILEKFAENVREIDRIYGKKEIEYDK